MGGTGLYLVAELGDGDQCKGFFLLSVLVVISFILSGLITFFKVKEKVVLGNQVQKFTLADVKNIIFSNDQLKALIGSILTFSMAAHLVGGFAIYYFTYAIGRGDLFPIFAAVSGAAEIAGVLRTSERIAAPSVESFIATKAFCTFVIVSEVINSGLYITGCDGAFPYEGSKM